LAAPFDVPDRGSGDDQNACSRRVCEQARRNQGIAGRIAAGLRTAGCKAEVRPVQDAGDLAAYDAFVIGSAAYELHWRKEATEFVRRNCKRFPSSPRHCTLAVTTSSSVPWTPGN
jgi:menaquinone-dependent protoporphyrinogen IX oxidase